MSAVDSSMVAHLPLFESLDTAACEAILREAHSIRVPKNKVVFEQGEDVHSFYLLLHGHIRATKMTPAGEQVIVRYVATGEIFDGGHLCSATNHECGPVAGRSNGCRLFGPGLASHERQGRPYEKSSKQFHRSLGRRLGTRIPNLFYSK